MANPVQILQKLPMPTGLSALLYPYSFAPAIWVSQGLMLLILFLRNPMRFLFRKDRSAIKFPDPMPGLKHEWLPVNGIKLHAVSFGRRPDKPLMLMLHGFPESWYSWRHQTREFQNDYEVVAIDMRGYGESDKPKGVLSYSLDKLAADIPAVVQALGRSSCTLVAHDWGGAVAWLVASMYPKVVDRLVVMAGPHMGLTKANMTTEQLKKSWYVMLFNAPFLPELTFLNNDSHIIKLLFTPGAGPQALRTPGVATPEDVEWFRQAIQRPGAATASINYYRALIWADLGLISMPQVWAALKTQIEVPVLVLWGDKDSALTTQLMNNVEQVAPAVELHVLKDCSHWVQQDKPQEVNQLMRSFLAKPGALQKSAL